MRIIIILFQKLFFMIYFFTFRRNLMALTKNQIGRYSRHLIMPEVGVNVVP